MELQGKKVLVFGSGKSGIGASDLLAKVGAFPVIYDGNAETDKDAVVHKTDGTYPVTVYAGELPKEVQDSLDLVVLSPGVPTDLPLVKSFYEQGLPVWGEVELAYRVGDGEVLAITGTNGKTTTTALLGKIMQDARESVFVVGNIGTPYTSKALEMKPNSITVAEISSFQLETIDEFAPKVSAILNITEDHLNRHHTMEEYIRVKELITENQGTEDVCVLNYEDEVLREFGKHLTPRVVYFSSGRKLDEGIYLDGNKIILKDGEKEIEAETLIISTGATAKYLGLEDEKKYAGMGVSACATCDGFFYRKKTVAVVGGGDTACEEAVYLAGLAAKVYLIVRKPYLRASKIMQERVMKHDKIEVLFEHNAVGLFGENGVEGVHLVQRMGEPDEKRYDVAIDGFFLAIGHKPNSDIFKPYVDTDEVGYIVTEPGTPRTKVPGVFAAGDVADPHYRQAITAAGTGCQAAIEAERYLSAKGVI